MSSFQLHFANYDILTPGDRPDVLVAMNPAALKANVADLPAGGVLIVNTDEFTKRNLTKVGYTVSPLDDGSLERYTVHQVAMATLTRGALEETGLSKKDAERAKNMFALGLLSWMYHRPTEGTERFLREKFAKRPDLAEANVLAFRAGPRVRRDHRVVRRDVRGRAGAAARGHLPADHRQHRTGLRDRGRRAGQRVAGVPRLVPDHAGQRHPARAEQAQGASASRPSRPRTRSPASVRRWARRSAARWASPPPPAPGSR